MPDPDRPGVPGSLDRWLGERRSGIAHLATGLAHDLGNMVLMLRGRSGENPEAFNRSCDRLAELVASLRLLGTGVDQAENDPGVELSSWWAEGRPLFQSVLGSQIALTGEFEGEGRVRLGRGLLTHVVLDLLRNSAEAMKQSSGSSVRISGVIEGTQAAIAVEDDGPGMAPEVLARCREAFFTTRGPGATGLGLTLAEHAARGLGGSMMVESVPGGGTRVTLLLPASPAAWRPPAGMPIYVDIEDARVRAMVFHELAQWGCEVRVRPEGGEAARVVDREDLLGDGRVVYLGTLVTARPGVVAVGPRPKLSDLRGALASTLRSPG